MKKNQGFIATSLLYTFFLVFCAVLMSLIANFLHNRTLLLNMIEEVKEDLTKIGNRTLGCTACVLGTTDCKTNINNCIPVKQGDYLKMEVTPTTISSDTSNLKWIVTNNITPTASQVSIISDAAFIMTNQYFNREDLSEKILATFDSGSRVSITTPTTTDMDAFESPALNDTIRKALTGAITVSSHPSASSTLPGEFVIFNSSTAKPILYKYTCLLSTGACRTNRYNIPTSSTTQYGIRAIITLYTSRTIIGGSGSITDPYVLGA